jgi:methyl coenzyme M reductase gamma subunit
LLFFKKKFGVKMPKNMDWATLLWNSRTHFRGSYRLKYIHSMSQKNVVWVLGHSCIAEDYIMKSTRMSCPRGMMN